MTMTEKLARVLASYVPEQIANEAVEAVLTALLDPDQKMVLAGDIQLPDEYNVEYDTTSYARIMFQAMILAALDKSPV